MLRLPELFLPIALLSVILFSCDEPTSATYTPTLTLEAENIEATEITLRLVFGPEGKGNGFRILRNDDLKFEGSLRGVDTFFVDQPLIPGQTYRYSAYRLADKSVTDRITDYPVRTLDSTSHEVTWYLDTLGIDGLVKDIAFISSDNIWVVGELNLSLDDRYNAARWNGTEWTFFRIPVFYSSTDFCVSCQQEAVFAFSPSNIWVGSGTRITRWNGVEAKGFFALPIHSLTKIWGTDPNNVYAVGAQGGIAHYDGKSWTLMETGTTVDLEDIWGVDAENVWATGTSIATAECVLLALRNGKWEIVYSNVGQPIPKSFGVRSIWSNRNNMLYLSGRSGTWKFDLRNYFWNKVNTGQQWVSYEVRGTDVNDIFISGQMGEIGHFNGSTWHIYPYLENLTGGRERWPALSVSKQMVVAGGYSYNLTYTPIVIRGYR